MGGQPNARSHALLVFRGQGPWTTAWYIASALRRAGFNVTTAGPGQEVDLPRKGYPAGHSLDVAAVWRRLESDGRRPDFLLAVDSGGTLYLPGVARLPIPIAYYAIDGHNWPRSAGAMASQFDAVFVAQRSCLGQLHLDRGRRQEWIPLAVDPTVFYPAPSAVARFDFAFVGNPSSGGTFRSMVLTRTSEMFHGTVTKASPESSPEVYCAADVGLNISGNQVMKDVNMRTFEIPACRIPLLTDGDPSALAQLFRMGHELEHFSGVDDCLSKLRRLLDSTDRRSELAQAGWERVKRDHTYDARVRRMLDIIDSTGVTRGRRSLGAQVRVRAWQTSVGAALQHQDQMPSP